jgi:hypothetical protein
MLKPWDKDMLPFVIFSSDVDVRHVNNLNLDGVKHSALEDVNAVVVIRTRY